jgi:hypothetical protein
MDVASMTPWVVLRGVVRAADADEPIVQLAVDRFAAELANRGIVTRQYVHRMGRDPLVGVKVTAFRNAGQLITVYVDAKDVQRDSYEVRSTLVPVRGRVIGAAVVETVEQLVGHACMTCISTTLALRLAVIR